MESLEGKCVAILADNGFEYSELSSPKESLEKAGAKVEIVSTGEGEIRGWSNDEWKGSYNVDRTIGNVSHEKYDALIIPGGVMSPDALRKNTRAVEFVRSFFSSHKPVAAICHGSQLLIDAEVLEGREITSYPSIQKDLENAGAKWVNQEVVVDQALVTSRTPSDLEAFNKKVIEEINEGKHAKQTV